MAETDLNTIEDERPRKLHWEWTLPTFLHPKKTLSLVAAQEKGVWFTPLLILSILAIVFVLISAPTRTQTIQNQAGASQPPDGFEYWAPEQQEQWFQSQSNKSGPLFVYVFPALSELGEIWIGWVLLGSILNLSLILNGSRGNGTTLLNITGWAFLPFAIRYLVRIISVLTTHQLIGSPGLSGLIAADASGFLMFLRPVLAHIDFYFLWMVALLIIGVMPVAGLKRTKVIFAILFSVLIVLALQALPGYTASKLGNLSLSGGFFF